MNFDNITAYLLQWWDGSSTLKLVYIAVSFICGAAWYFIKRHYDNKSIKRYMSTGMTREEAKKKVKSKKM